MAPSKYLRQKLCRKNSLKWSEKWGSTFNYLVKCLCITFTQGKTSVCTPRESGFSTVIPPSSPTGIKSDYMTKRWEYIPLVLASLHWLPVSIRIDFKMLLFTFLSLNGLVQKYISDLLMENAPSRPVWSADGALLVNPRLYFGTKGFVVRAPKRWNSLLRCTKSLPFCLYSKHLWCSAFLLFMSFWCYFSVSNRKIHSIKH